MTKLQIINIALRILGMTALDDLDGDDPSTLVMEAMWDICVESVFEEHNWSFAKVQAVLTESSETPPIGWTYAYDHPGATCSAVWNVFNESTLANKDQQDFDTYYMTENAAKVIVTDLSYAYVEFTYIISDTTTWPKMFARAVAHLLAASACHLLTGDAEKGIKLLEIYSMIISEAKRVDYSRRTKKSKVTSSYKSAR